MAALLAGIKNMNFLQNNIDYEFASKVQESKSEQIIKK
jgi:hypothetical protein